MIEYIIVLVVIAFIMILWGVLFYISVWDRRYFLSLISLFMFITMGTALDTMIKKEFKIVVPEKTKQC